MKIKGLKSLDVFHLIGGNNLKKDLLYFDEIIIDEKQYQMCLSFLNSSKNLDFEEQMRYQIIEVDYLEKKGLVKIENTENLYKNINSFSESDLINLTRDDRIEFKDLRVNDEKVRELIRLTSLQNIESNLNARIICSKLNEEEIFDIKPIMEIRTNQDVVLPYLNSTKNIVEKNIQVANLVLKKFPVPDSNTSWEEIIDFKENNDLKVYRLGLLEWISEIGRSDLKIYEIEQKLEYLLAKYEEEMKIQKLQYRTATTELIVTTSLHIIENIIKLNWSKSAQSIFDLKKNKVDLLKGETIAPGREVAYLSKLNSKFN